MAKTIEELKKLMNDQQTSPTRYKELSDDELKDIVGGDIQGTSPSYLHGTYPCPLCGKKHEFIAELIHGYSNAIGEVGIISKNNACKKTEELSIFDHNFLYGNVGTIDIRDTNYKRYYSTFTLDYFNNNGFIINLIDLFNK